MTTDTLRGELLALSGVADAEVDSTSTPPDVRVHLAPGADPRAVGVQVQRVLASHGLRSRMADGMVVAPPEASSPAPPAPQATAAGGIVQVTVDETAEGVTVTVSTADGRSETHPGEPSEQGIAQAAVAAVGKLATGASARLVWMSTAEAEGTTVVSVLLERTDGARLAGAATVRGSLAHAVARASWNALGG